jgi:hypothetical protein
MAKKTYADDKPIKEPAIKIGDILNFTSAVIVFLATAIIYLEGWIYASSWYGFFNIDVSQIVLPPPTILIDGIPAIAVALFVLGLSILITLAINIILHRPNLSRLDTPLLVFFSVGVLTIFIFLLQRFLYPIVTLETHVINGTIKYESKMVDNISVTSLGFFNHVFFAVIIPLLCILLLLILATNILTKSKLQRPSSTEKIYKLLQQFLQNWKLWGCILLLVYLFMAHDLIIRDRQD